MSVTDFGAQYGTQTVELAADRHLENITADSGPLLGHSKDRKQRISETSTGACFKRRI